MIWPPAGFERERKKERGRESEGGRQSERGRERGSYNPGRALISPGQTNRLQDPVTISMKINGIIKQALSSIKHPVGILFFYVEIQNCNG